MADSVSMHVLLTSLNICTPRTPSGGQLSWSKGCAVWMSLCGLTSGRLLQSFPDLQVVDWRFVGQASGSNGMADLRSMLPMLCQRYLHMDLMVTACTMSACKHQSTITGMHLVEFSAKGAARHMSTIKLHVIPLM